jgi:hypothetical protein
MALSSDAVVSIVFGIFMAIVAILALWQVAHYASRGFRMSTAFAFHETGRVSCVSTTNSAAASMRRSDSSELEAGMNSRQE